MNTDWCYSGFGWRVFRNNALIGYVVASSENKAVALAKDKYGDSIRVEKVMAPSYSG